MFFYQVLTTIEGSSSEPSPCPSPCTYVTPFISSITTNFPLPPACQILPLVGASLAPPSSTTPPLGSPQFECQNISPLPEVRRESECDLFQFPPTIPVPSAFADGDANKEMTENVEAKDLGPEDIEVRIQSSNDNLVNVEDDEEAFIAEEKSISDILSSITSLDTSIDMEELDNEEEGRGERLPPDGEGREADEEEDKEDKTEKDSGDSEGTDDTVREKKGSSGEKEDEESPVTEIPDQLEFIDDISEPEDITKTPPPAPIPSQEDTSSQIDDDDDDDEDDEEDEDEHNEQDSMTETDQSATDRIPAERIVEGAEMNEDERGLFCNFYIKLIILLLVVNFHLIEFRYIYPLSY